METARPTINHPVFARLYGRFSAAAEARGVAEHRERLLAGLSGRVLELGAGTGLNFGHYPSTVTEVVAIEPEPYLRERALDAAAAVSVPVTVADAVGEAIPFPDSSFDAVVASLVLCSVSDQALVLAEFRRVLKPGGSLRYYEHVVSRSPGRARMQRLLDTTVWPRVAGGCHLARDTGASIRAAGFTVEHEQHLLVKTSTLEPAIGHLLGGASLSAAT